MADSNALFGFFGVIGSAIVYGLSNVWINRRKKQGGKGCNKDYLIKHPVFARIKQLKLEEVHGMTTGNKLKDEAMKKYANLFLGIYADDLMEFAQNVKENGNGDSISKFYYDMIEKLNYEMDKSGIAPEYLEKIYSGYSVERLSLSNEIAYIQKDADLTYLQKVANVFDAIRIHLGIIIGKLEGITSTMNGELEEALKKQKGI